MNESTAEEKYKTCCNNMVNKVSLLTEEEIEIEFFTPPLNPMKKDNYRVYVNSSETYDFQVLSFFNNTVTLRLKEGVIPESDLVEIKILAEKNEPKLLLHKANYAPYYSFLDMGIKSKIKVRGSASVPQEVVKQASEGINKMFGRTGYLSFLLYERGCRISIVGPNESVYNVPEYRELYDEKDAMTRVTIPGTPEKPVIVTTSKDVMRERGINEYAMIRDLSRLFYQVSISGGAEALKGYDIEPELSNIPARLKEAYECAKESSLWCSAFMETEEEYFVRGTMIFFELTPESEDGSWESGIGPVNTRLEMREYDRKLFDVLAEIYGEFEYLSPYEDSKCMPWFVGTQPNKFGIDGKPLPKAEISQVNLISPHHIEVKFNRQVFNAEDKDKYEVVFTEENGEPKKILDFKVLPYAWDTITLEFGNWNLDGEKAECIAAPNFVKGKICADITGDVLKKGEYADSSHAEINGSIKLKVTGSNIVDWDGNSLGTKEYAVALKPYFTKIKRTNTAGIYIYASERVKTETIELCSSYVDEMLSNKTYGQKIADGITYNGGGLSIIAEGEHAYMQPHLRSYYSNFGLYVEGFGGGIAQTTEINVLRIKSRTRYKNEFILGHEFGHTIEMTGIRFGLPKLYDEVGEIYEKVIKAGLWANSYAGSNRNEYFATLANTWFSIMSESVKGNWDGTRGPVNTREELYRYDIDGYNLMKKVYYNGTEVDDSKIIYEKNFAGSVWESYSVPNNYDIDGSLYK